MTPEDLRELAFRMETGIDIVTVIENLGQVDVSDTNQAMKAMKAMAEEIETKVRSAELTPSAVLWVGTTLANLGLRMKQEAYAKSLLEPDLNEDQEAKVIQWRQKPSGG